MSKQTVVGVYPAVYKLSMNFSENIYIINRCVRPVSYREHSVPNPTQTVYLDAPAPLLDYRTIYWC